MAAFVSGAGRSGVLVYWCRREGAMEGGLPIYIGPPLTLIQSGSPPHSQDDYTLVTDL